MMLTYSEILKSIDLNRFDLVKELKLTVFKSPEFTGGSQTFTIGCHKGCHKGKGFIFFLWNYLRQFRKHCNTPVLNVLSEYNCVSGYEFWSKIIYTCISPK